MPDAPADRHRRLWRVVSRCEALERWPGADRYERESGRPTPFFRLVPMSSRSS